jgi:uncharacterized protein involved in exopolysaccharide biosynthesis
MEKITLHHDAETPSAIWQTVIFPILRYKRMTYTMITVAVSVTLIVALLIPNRYTSTAILLPTANNDQISDLKDMAAGALGDLGLGTLKQANDQSSALYPQILTSRTIEEAILQRPCTFEYEGETKTMTMAEYLDQPNVDLALLALGERIGVSLDRKTGVVYLSVTTKYPGLSAAVVHGFLDELNDYNVNKRQSKASANEHFIGKRLDQIKTELAAAEDSLLVFKRQNQNFETGGDPTLQMELERRERTAALKTEEFALMTKQYELAKIDAVKDIPVVNILDSGAVPIEKSWPHRSVYLISAFLFSLLGGIILSLWRDLSGKRRFGEQFERSIHSPELHFNRLEERIIGRMATLAGASVGQGSSSERKGNDRE